MKNDRIFLMFLITGSLLVVGVVADHIRTWPGANATLPAPRSKIDVEQLRRKFNRTGIIPREARYWKSL